jgi:class 3 adenylate cyclase
MAPSAERGAQDSLTLRFLDASLEDHYQRAAGNESIGGFRMIALASFVLWTPVAFLLPVATDLAPAFAIPVGLAMSAISFVVLALSKWATTLDRQHALASLLTSANGTVILALALIGGALPGYGIAAAMLLFAWGFVSRTRFVYAALRTAVVGLAFIVAVILYAGPANLSLDVLLFGAGAAGSLLALRILESSRRQLFFQELVIREQSAQLAAEMAKSEQLILNILPSAIATRLRSGESTIADDYAAVSVLFGDIVGFTPLAAQLSARQVIELLSRLFAGFDKLVEERGLEKIKTIGDNYMVVGGLTETRGDHALSIVRLGLAMLDEAARHEALGRPLQLRIGVHSGPVVGGVIGTRKLAFDLWGDTVNVASRLQELGPPGRIHLSETTWRLVRDHFDGEAMGETQLRGHSRMHTYSVVGPSATAMAG